MTNQSDVWTAGATWVFQGTVLEDATAGTHLCSLTVTPGAGNELQLLYGRIKVGATATAQTSQVTVDDGTNNLWALVNPQFVSATTTSLIYDFPATGQVTTAVFPTDIDFSGPISGIFVSGTMRLTLLVSTVAVSVTQTFAVVCRIKGAVPTATLADTVGTPTLTTNTNRVF